MNKSIARTYNVHERHSLARVWEWVREMSKEWVREMVGENFRI